MRVAGRFARRMTSLEPSMVSHGPAMTSPAITTSTPARNSTASRVVLVCVPAPMSWM
jgi:hypothetical protein